jgi:hypothetical protein
MAAMAAISGGEVAPAMRADDEHDPLDQWLNQQVQPLPPPPGTFELITRRARGRKLRKLAVTVASAAAVAAAVAVAVPAGLHLNLSQPPTKGSYAAAGGATPSGTGHQSPTGKASTLKLSPSPTVTTQPTAVPPGPVPKNFQPSSVTFVSGTAAWAIGQAGIPGHCDNKDPYICTSIARTNDAGASWVGGPAPNTGAPNGATGVSGIRFLNGTDGWAFGPELWATHDGGKTWIQVSTDDQRVTDLETSDGRAYALFATCSTPANVASPPFAVDCTRFTLMSTTAGSDDWQPVGGATNGLTNGGSATSAVLQLTGTNGYLLAPNGALYSGLIGGPWSQVATARCEPGAAQADGLPSGAQLALENSTNLAIACSGTSVSDPPAVYTSADGGALWTQPPAAAWSDITNLSGFGVTMSLAEAPGGTLTLASSGGIYVLAAGSERWKPSNATGGESPQGGFSYVGMTTAEQGVALPTDTSLHQIWMTYDGGATWHPITLSS